MLHAHPKNCRTGTKNLYGFGIRFDSREETIPLIGHGLLTDPMIDGDFVDLKQFARSQETVQGHSIIAKVSCGTDSFSLSLEIASSVQSWPRSSGDCLDCISNVGGHTTALDLFKREAEQIKWTQFFTKSVPSPSACVRRVTDKGEIFIWEHLGETDTTSLLIILAMITEGMAIKAAQHELPDRGG